MSGIYDFLSGPMAWVAFGIFIFGSIYRLVSMYRLAKQKDMAALAYMDVKFSARSIIRWLTPFWTLGWRSNPAVTVAAFVFHIGFFLTVIFAGAHVTIWDYSFGISYASLPDNVTDILTVLVILSCAYFAVRRFTQPHVRFVTRPMDWLVLFLAATPFVTGFLAYHQLINYDFIIILHVLFAEILLISIPFTRLSHALFSPFTRAYMGSEFGAVRHTIDY